MTDGAPRTPRSGSLGVPAISPGGSGVSPAGSTLGVGMLSSPGPVLGKYQLIAEIARGGMGVVYLAMVQGPGGFHKLVVVKELKPELVEEPAFLTMFLDEARLAARLSHPNIVQTNEVGNDGERYFMAMDYLDGRGLDQIRRRTRALGPGHGLSMAMQLRVVCDMLAGLDYAHRLADFDGSPLHIVHRDVSPQNVFVTFDGQVKLLDFGIAKAADSVHETHAGVVKGKVAYMSPEQGRGWKVDARSDVFSAGVMLWEALTGKRMREGQNDQEKMWALASEDIPRASSIVPTVPTVLDAICARAMAWNREDRYASAAELQRELEGYLASSGTNPTAREVGACISEVFREDRANTNTVIEAHVARLRGGQVRDQLPIIDVSARAGGQSATPSNERASHSLRVRQAETVVPIVGEAGQTRLTGQTGITGLTSVDPPSVRSGEASNAMHETRSSRGRNLRSVLIAGVTGVVVAAVVIILVARATQDAGSFARRDPAPPVAGVPTTPAPAKPSFIDVEIRVVPPTARISIDGTDVDGNPFVSRYTSDTAVHHVRASAPGHVAKSVPVSFDRRLALEITLDPIAAPVAASPEPPARTPPARAPAVRTPARTSPARTSPRPPEPARPTAPEPEPPAPTPPAPRPRTDVDPAGGTKPRRPIDVNNPYGAGE